MFARMRSFLPATILALLIAYFGYQAFIGDRGFLTRNQRNVTLEEKNRRTGQAAGRSQGS